MIISYEKDTQFFKRSKRFQQSRIQLLLYKETKRGMQGDSLIYRKKGMQDKVDKRYMHVLYKDKIST